MVAPVAAAAASFGNKAHTTASPGKLKAIATMPSTKTHGVEAVGIQTAFTPQRTAAVDTAYTSEALIAATSEAPEVTKTNTGLVAQAAKAVASFFMKGKSKSVVNVNETVASARDSSSDVPQTDTTKLTGIAQMIPLSTNTNDTETSVPTALWTNESNDVNVTQTPDSEGTRTQLPDTGQDELQTSLQTSAKEGRGVSLTTASDRLDYTHPYIGDVVNSTADDVYDVNSDYNGGGVRDLDGRLSLNSSEYDDYYNDGSSYDVDPKSYASSLGHDGGVNVSDEHGANTTSSQVDDESHDISDVSNTQYDDPTGDEYGYEKDTYNEDDYYYDDDDNEYYGDGTIDDGDDENVNPNAVGDDDEWYYDDDEDAVTDEDYSAEDESQYTVHEGKPPGSVNRGAGRYGSVLDDKQWLQQQTPFHQIGAEMHDVDTHVGPLKTYTGIRSYSYHSSALRDNSMSLLVFYTWLGAMALLALITLVGFKHRQRISNMFWEAKTGYWRRGRGLRERQRQATDEGHTLLPPHQHV